MIYQVTVRAGARRRAVEPQPDGSLKVWTTTAPEKGKANDDVVDLLAEHFNVSRSRVEIVRGATSSRKTIKIIAQ